MKPYVTCNFIKYRDFYLNRAKLNYVLALHFAYYNFCRIHKYYSLRSSYGSGFD
jgi:hypothetical protein